MQPPCGPFPASVISVAATVAKSIGLPCASFIGAFSGNVEPAFLISVPSAEGGGIRPVKLNPCSLAI